MSDDFDDLFDTPASPHASPHAAPATPPQVTTPVPGIAKSPFLDPDTVWMPLLKPGTEVRFQDKPYTVGHVLISKGDLFVNLKEVEGAILADKVRVKLTEIKLSGPNKVSKKG